MCSIGSNGNSIFYIDQPTQVIPAKMTSFVPAVLNPEVKLPAVCVFDSPIRILEIPVVEKGKEGAKNDNEAARCPVTQLLLDGTPDDSGDSVQVIVRLGCEHIFEAAAFAAYEESTKQVTEQNYMDHNVEYLMGQIDKTPGLTTDQKAQQKKQLLEFKVKLRCPECGEVKAVNKKTEFVAIDQIPEIVKTIFNQVVNGIVEIQEVDFKKGPKEFRNLLLKDLGIPDTSTDNVETQRAKAKFAEIFERDGIVYRRFVAGKVIEPAKILQPAKVIKPAQMPKMISPAHTIPGTRTLTTLGKIVQCPLVRAIAVPFNAIHWILHAATRIIVIAIAIILAPIVTIVTLNRVKPTAIFSVMKSVSAITKPSLTPLGLIRVGFFSPTYQIAGAK